MDATTTGTPARPTRLRYRAGSRLIPPAVLRVIVLLSCAVAFVPGIWIVAGAFIGANRSVALLGIPFLAFAGFLAWGWIWRYAVEVEVEGGEIRWRGYLRSGTAPLADLRRVAWSRYMGTVLDFHFQSHQTFSVLPGRGIVQLLQRLSEWGPNASITTTTGLFGWVWPGKYEES